MAVFAWRTAMCRNRGSPLSREAQKRREMFIMQSMMAQPRTSLSPFSFQARMNRPASRFAACMALRLASSLPVSFQLTTEVGRYMKPTSWCRP